MALPRAQVDRILLFGWSAAVAALYLLLVERVAPPDVPSWLLAVAVLAVWMVGNVALALRQVRQWRRMAREALLQPVGDPSSPLHWLGMPPLQRSIGDRRVVVRTEASTSRRNRRVWTLVETDIGRTPLDLRVAGEDWWERLTGGADLETGDRAFDERFRIETSDPDRALQVLSGSVRERLGRLEPMGIVRIGDGRVQHRIPYVVLDPDVAEGQMRAVCQLADTVDRVQGWGEGAWEGSFATTDR